MEEGDEYAIETKEKWKYRAPSDLHPGGGRRGFGRELGAFRMDPCKKIGVGDPPLFP
jgi:hypothetical protein